MKKIALFGFYKYKNFGDDLMAVMYSLYLKEKGFAPIVYGLSRELSLEYGIETAETVSAVLENADYAIIGGGGILTYNQSPQDSVFIKFREDLFAFVSLAEDLNIPIGAFSIGGGSIVNGNTPLHYGQAKLLLSKNLKIVTVRRYEDKLIFEKIGCPVKWAPDVVLSFNLSVKKQKKSDKRQINIGINLWKRGGDVALIKYLKILSLFNQNLKITFFETHPPNAASRCEYISNHTSENQFYTGMQSYLEKLSEMDLVISCKLHFGVTAISMGIPFISWGGGKKTQGFFRSVQLELGLIENRRISRFKFVFKLLRPRTLIRCLSNELRANTFRFDEGKRHLEELTKFLKGGGFLEKTNSSRSGLETL